MRAARRRFGKQAELQFASPSAWQRATVPSALVRKICGSRPATSWPLAGGQPRTARVGQCQLWFDPKVRIIEAGGMKLGVTSVLGKEYQAQVHNDEVEIQPAAEALKQVVPQLAECDVRILLADTTVAEAQELARQFPEFSLVVVAETDGPDPPAQPKKIEGTETRLIEMATRHVRDRGRLLRRQKQPIRFQAVPLDSRYPDSPGDEATQ
jgi:hypothetical protein